MNNEIQNELARKFTKKFEEYNTKVLESLGYIIKRFNGLNNTQAYKLMQELKYNISANDLIKELSVLSDKSIKEIELILEEIAKQNIQFGEVYYKAKGLDVPIYKKNGQFQRLVQSIANTSNMEFMNLAGSTGFKLLDRNGNNLFLNINDTYNYVIDECVYALTTGKSTYQEQMRKLMKQLSSSGVQKIEYQTGYTRRLDSSARMNILDTIKQIHNETQQLIGKEIDSDGVEVSVHINPAPDHEKVQGKQFTNDEFDKLQSTGIATTYDGEKINLYLGNSYRPISELNCYHYIFSVVLGISKPRYTKEELNDIIKEKNKTFNFEGKEYNMYEGEQLKRTIETAIRYAKDDQIIAKSAGDSEMVMQSQRKISQLTYKYKKLCNISGLKNELSTRARVSGYKRKKVSI